MNNIDTIKNFLDSPSLKKISTRAWIEIASVISALLIMAFLTYFVINLKNKAHKLNSEIQTLTQKNTQLNSDIGTKNNEINQLKIENQTLNQTNDELTSEKGVLTQRNTQLNSNIQKKNTKIDELNSNIQKKETEINQLKTENEALNQKNTQLNSEIETKKNEINKLTIEKEALNKTNDELTSEKENLNEKINELNFQIDQQNANIKDLEKTNSKLKSDDINNINNISTLLKKKEELENELNKYKTEEFLVDYMPHYHDPKENNDNFWTMNVNKKAKLQTNMKTNSTLKDQIIEGIISRENDYRRFFKEKNVVQNEASKISRNDLFGGPSKEGASKEGASSVLRYTNAMNEIIINNIDSLRLLKSEADNKIKKKFDNIEKIFIRNKIQLKKNPSMINFVFTSEQIEIMLGEIIKQTNQGISDEIKEKYFQNEISTKENKSLIGSFLSGVKNFIPIGSSNTPNK